jgi:hypothetical protein
MVDVVSGIGVMLSSLFGEIGRWVIGLLFIGLIGYIVYIIFVKPKPIDYGNMLFLKLFEAGKERLPLKPSKKLALCPMSINVEDIRTLPIHQIHHQPIGDIVGLNVLGVITSMKELYDLSNDPSNENYQKLLLANQEAIKNDKFWICLCYQRQVGKFIIPITKKCILLLKEKQIVSISSLDNVIRVRGYGLLPVGQYELVVDHDLSTNYKQFVLDQEQLISSEIILASFGKLGQIVESAMKSDSVYRKDVAITGLNVVNKPETKDPV